MTYHALVNVSKSKANKWKTVATWDGNDNSCLATAQKIFALYGVNFHDVAFGNIIKQKNHIGNSENCLHIPSGQDDRLIAHDNSVKNGATSDLMDMFFYGDDPIYKGLTKEDYLTLPRDW